MPPFFAPFGHSLLLCGRDESRPHSTSSVPLSPLFSYLCVGKIPYACCLFPIPIHPLRHARSVPISAGLIAMLG